MYRTELDGGPDANKFELSPERSASPRTSDFPRVRTDGQPIAEGLVGGNRHSIANPEFHPRPEGMGVKSRAIHSTRAAMASVVIAKLGFISIRPKPCRPVDWSWRSPTGQRPRDHSVRGRENQAILWSGFTRMAGSSRGRSYLEDYSAAGDGIHR